jgi:hypothetical protein
MIGAALGSASCIFVGCASTDAGPIPVSHGEQGLALRADQVVLQLELGQGQVTVRGDQLTAGDRAEQIDVKGNVSVQVSGPAPLQARAEQIAVQAEGPVLELSGKVRARLTLPEEGERRDR